MRTALLSLVCLMVAPAALVAAPSTRPAVELTAHRGESKDAPENTMAAFKLAWDRGVAAVELDVHLTKDGKLICVHDADTERTGGTKLVVKESTVAELQQLDVGSWKAPAFADEKMPLLDDALASIPAGNRRLFIEVKVGPEAVPELVRCLERAAKPAEQTVVIAFDIETVRAAKKALPKLKVYWLAQQKQDKESGAWGPPVAELVAKAKDAGADGLDVAGSKHPVDAAFVKAAKAAGLELYVWTIDDPARAKELVSAGVDGITTNRAAWMKEQLAK